MFYDLALLVEEQVKLTHSAKHKQLSELMLCALPCRAT